MTITTLDKNSIGVCLSLLLVILLSETKLFKFFIDTYLGRAFLIIILLIASYLNKILGVACVFIIIIMFNNKNMSSYYEGFLEGNNPTDTNGGKKDKTPPVTNDDITDPVSEKPTTPVPNDKINVVTDPVTSSKDTKNVSSNDSSKSDSNDVVTKAIEGFDLQCTENNIKRGKQSNSIPVSQYNKQSIEVAPYECASFSNFFGLL